MWQQIDENTTQPGAYGNARTHAHTRAHSETADGATAALQ